MKNFFALACLAMAVSLGTGCTYNASVDTVKNVNVYSAYEEKIPGNFAIIIDSDSSVMNVNISSSTRVCWTDTYEISFSNTFISSIKKANEHIFQSITPKNTIPTVSEMKKDNLAGYIFIQCKFFEPRISVNSGAWTSKANVTVGIGFDYIIRDNKNNVIITGTISSERTHEDSIYLCSQATEVINIASQKAMRDALERYGERISNSQKLRDAIKSNP